MTRWNQDGTRSREADLIELQNNEDDQLSFDKESENTQQNLNNIQADLQAEIDRTMDYSEEDQISIGGQNDI